MDTMNETEFESIGEYGGFHIVYGADEHGEAREAQSWADEEEHHPYSNLADAILSGSFDPNRVGRNLRSKLEEWRPHPSLKCECSNFGRVRNLQGNHLQPRLSSAGHLTVRVQHRKRSHRSVCRLQRLVAEAWNLPNPRGHVGGKTEASIFGLY